VAAAAAAAAAAASLHETSSKPAIYNRALARQS